MKISTHIKSGEKEMGTHLRNFFNLPTSYSRGNIQMLSGSCLKQNLDKQDQTKVRKSKREKRFQ